MDVDEALGRLGKFGKWQMIKYTMVCMSVTFPGCWHMMAIVFTGGEPAHHCFVPPGAAVNESIPLVKEGKKLEYSKCERYVNITVSNKTTPCDDGWYYEPEYDSTIVTEWDLVCEKNYLVETSQSVFSFGVMVGAVVFTSLADRIGRKPVHLTCQYLMLITGLIIAFSPNYITFVVFRFLQGAVREGAGLVGIVMACELFPASQRTFAGTALELFWAAAWMVLALLAYLITNWRHLQLAVTIPPAVTVALIWFLPESVPWLVSNGRIDEAEKILQDAAKFNGVVMPNKILHDHFQHEEKEESKTHQKKMKSKRHKATKCDENDSSSITEVVTEKTKMLSRQRSKFTHESQTDRISESNHVDDVIKNNAVDVISNHDDVIGDEVTSQDGGLNSKSTRRRKSDLVVDFVHKVLSRTSSGADDHVVEDEVGQIQYSCLDLLKSRVMVVNTFIMCSLWFASGLVYFGLSLNTSSLVGDKYVNFFLSGAVEAPAYLLTVFVLERYGRRLPLFLFHLVAGVVLLAVVFIPEETDSGTSLAPVVITLTMIGKFAMTAAFGTVVLFAPELYPTNLRNIGFGMASVSGRLGGMIAPFSSYVMKFVPWVPGVCFSVVAIVTGIMAMFLPEPLNRPLPETIEEIEKWTSSPGDAALLIHENQNGSERQMIRNSGKVNNETML